MKAHFPLSLYGQERQRTRLTWVPCCFAWLTAALAEPHNNEKAMCLRVLCVFSSLAWAAHTCTDPKANMRVLCSVVFYPVWAACCVLASFPRSRWVFFSQQEARGFCRCLLSAGGEAHATALLCAWSCHRGTFSWEAGPSAAARWKWQVSWVGKVISTESGHLHKVLMRNARVTPERVGIYLPESISALGWGGAGITWCSGHHRVSCF